MSRPLNIAVVGACPYPVPQGSQVYLRNTALALRDAGHHVRLVTYGYGLGEDPSGLALHRAPNLPGAHRIAAGPSVAKPLQDALLVRTLRQVVRDHQVDVVDAHNYEGLAVALAAGKRPIVYHAHNALADELPHYFPNRANAAWLGRAFDKTLPRRADLVIAPHEELAVYLLGAGCAEERIRTVPPPVDLDSFAVQNSESALPSLLYAGNLDAYQNLDLLGPVMRRVRESVPEAEFVIATGATSTPALLRAAEFGRVIREDSLNAALRELPQGAIFLCPRASWSGYPMKLLNAMASGLPIVCSESAGHPFTGEENALLVPDNDAEAFAAAVIRLLRDPGLRARLGAAARRAAEQRHSFGAVSALLDPLFRSLPPRSP